jgi:aminoglycoside phosphotransferase (APT) family kinase protein
VDGVEGEVRAVVGTHVPGYRVDSVVRIGGGLDNVVYEVNGELLVRFARRPDPAQLHREARLLGVVAGVSPVPVPRPIFTVPERGCLAYRRLPGVVLLDMPAHQRAEPAVAIGRTLGDLLTALHSVPTSTVAGLVGSDRQPLADWLREAAELYVGLAGRIPSVRRGPVEAFLAADPPADRDAPVFSHNDLGIEHVLVDPNDWVVTGVIDWGDAAIVDPAYDFGLLYRDLGPAALRAAISNYRVKTDVDALAARAEFYARCSVFEDLAYAIDTGRHAYRQKCLTALRWLFPA